MNYIMIPLLMLLNIFFIFISPFALIFIALWQGFVAIYAGLTGRKKGL